MATLIVLVVPSRPYILTHYWTSTSLQWRFHVHGPQLQASFSPLLRMQIWPIKMCGTEMAIVINQKQIIARIVFLNQLQ